MRITLICVLFSFACSNSPLDESVDVRPPDDSNGNRWAIERIAPPVIDAPDYGGYRPHYQGHGFDTPGGRGGEVCVVNSLADDGWNTPVGTFGPTGTLRDCVAERPGCDGTPERCARIVVFELSGTIELQYLLEITSPYITIAGQTAPSPGINVRNWPPLILTSHVVLQHLRFRTGNTHMTDPGHFTSIQSGMSGGTMYPSSHVIVDHVSVAWTMYMGWAIASDESSIFDSISAFGLSTGIYKENGLYSGMGGAIGRGGATHARNLYVHNSHRQPIVGPAHQRAAVADLYNNIVYGSGPGAEAEDYTFTMIWQNSCGGGHSDNMNPEHRSLISYVNNIVIPSLGTGSGQTAGSDGFNKYLFMNVGAENLQYQANEIWLRGNQGPYVTGPDEFEQWDGVLASSICDSITDPHVLRAALAPPTEPSWLSQYGYSVVPTDEVPDYVFANVGARPLDRDPIDEAAVAQARAGYSGDTAGMGSRITSPEDMGGHPVLAENHQPLSIPDNPHDVAPGETFRTNIEVWLESLARDLEPAH